MDQGRALLIESHPLLRQTLGQLLTDIGLCIYQAGDAVDGICIAVQIRPEFIILDATTRDMSSLALSELLHRLLPQSKVILLVDDMREYVQPTAEHSFACLHKRAAAHDLPLLINRLSATGQEE